MPRFIIHKDGMYNEYTTIADGACWDGGLTLEELKRVLRPEIGTEFGERLERAHKTGCSGIGWSLDDCIACNRAGPNESRLSQDEFVARYLTRQPDQTSG